MIRARETVDYHEMRLRTPVPGAPYAPDRPPEEPIVTSPSTGTRRLALVALAVGLGPALAACGSGQISQTANQESAVDGGSGSAGNLSVNDVRVVLPDADGPTGNGAAELGFTASYSGAGVGDPVRLERVTVGGVQVRVEAADPLARGCSLVATTAEGAAKDRKPVQGVCIAHTTASVPDPGKFDYGHSVPATFTFSDGQTVEALAGVVTKAEEAGTYTPPAESPEGEAAAAAH